jgi:hypothetical protein
VQTAKVSPPDSVPSAATSNTRMGEGFTPVSET